MCHGCGVYVVAGVIVDWLGEVVVLRRVRDVDVT
jgi:hypothetical protein